jgi:hypothetical protein
MFVGGGEGFAETVTLLFHSPAPVVQKKNCDPSTNMLSTAPF